MLAQLRSLCAGVGDSSCRRQLCSHALLLLDHAPAWILDAPDALPARASRTMATTLATAVGIARERLLLPNAMPPVLGGCLTLLIL